MLARPPWVMRRMSTCLAQRDRKPLLDIIIYSVSFAVVSFLCFAACMYFDKRLTLAAGVMFAVYIGLDDLATSLPRLSPIFDPIGGRWNWAGKLYSIALAAAVILGFRFKARDIGLTLRQRNVRTSLLAVLVLSVLSCSLGFLFRPDAPGMETLAFQLLMPGIAEELAYRGIAPAILLGLFRGKKAPGTTPWVVVLVTALAFGAWHGLNYSGGSYSFDLLSASFPFIGGLAYGWLRFHSGSLLLPIAAHGIGNTVFYLAAVL